MNDRLAPPQRRWWLGWPLWLVMGLLLLVGVVVGVRLHFLGRWQALQEEMRAAGELPSPSELVARLDWIDGDAQGAWDQWASDWETDPEATRLRNMEDVELQIDRWIAMGADPQAFPADLATVADALAEQALIGLDLLEGPVAERRLGAMTRVVGDDAIIAAARSSLDWAVQRSLLSWLQIAVARSCDPLPLLQRLLVLTRADARGRTPLGSYFSWGDAIDQRDRCWLQAIRCGKIDGQAAESWLDHQDDLLAANRFQVGIDWPLQLRHAESGRASGWPGRSRSWHRRALFWWLAARDLYVGARDGRQIWHLLQDPSALEESGTAASADTWCTMATVLQLDLAAVVAQHTAARARRLAALLILDRQEGLALPPDQGALERRHPGMCAAAPWRSALVYHLLPDGGAHIDPDWSVPGLHSAVSTSHAPMHLASARVEIPP